MNRAAAVAAVATIVVGSMGIGVVERSRNDEILNGIIDDRLDGANYVEGPSPILTPDGSVMLLHHEGYCCYQPRPYGPGWESGVNSIYRPTGPPEYKLLNTTAWSDDTHEQAQFTAVNRGLTLGAYTRTTWSSFPGENRGRISTFLASADMSVIKSVRHDAVVPHDPECVEVGSCYGAGVLYPSISPLPNGTTALWVNDDVRPTEEYRNVLRAYSLNILGSATHIFDAAFRDDDFKVVFPTVTDVGLGRDGVLYALASSGLWSGIEEWYSDGSTRVEIGKLWRPTGRRWESKHGLSVWDGGYLKDDTGTIVEPRVVVGVASRHGATADSGEWVFEWWGDPGATVPEWWKRHGQSTPTPTPTATPTPTRPPLPTPTPRSTAVPRIVIPAEPNVYPYTIMSWTLTGRVPHRLSMICGPVGCSMICGNTWIMQETAWKYVSMPGVSYQDDTVCSAWGAVYATVEREGDCRPLFPPRVINAQPPKSR